LKRATPTPNRFITCTPNWWVKAFVLFAFFFILDGCVDETSLTGFKKEPRMEVKFKEFIIPAVTVQADSINSHNLGAGSSTDRLLCGNMENPGDPYFGKIRASIFTKFLPNGAKVSPTGKSFFNITGLTFNVILDNYVYGDTLNGPSTFTLHEITDNNFNSYNDYYTNSSVNYDPNPLATATYEFYPPRFRADSVKKTQALNNDSNGTNNVYDSLTFNIPIQSTLARALFDTLRGKGFYSWRKINSEDSLAYNDTKTDSAFLKAFKGLAIIPQSGERVLGFTSNVSTLKGSTRLTLRYSYVEAGITKTGIYYYFIQDDSRFSQIQSDRSGATLSGLPPSMKYVDYSSPDDYSYLQSGTGLFTKLDFSAVRDTFSAYEKIAFNSAELVIPIEASTVRPHYRIPRGLQLRITKDNSRFFVPPQIHIKTSATSATIGPDPIYGDSYYCRSSDSYLDVRSDENDYISLEYEKDDNGNYYYRGYISEYLQYSTVLPTSVTGVNYLALVPSSRILVGSTTNADVGFGRSLDGISFKKDQIKLRVFYSVPK
jgi:hypothetical protein